MAHLAFETSRGVLMPPLIDPSLACAARRLVPRPQPPEAPAQPPPLRIACFGTSITRGDYRVKETDAYPHVLRKLLRARFPKSSVRVAAFGYPGASPQYLHACLDSMLPDADLYIVELADNYMSKPAQYAEAARLVGQIVLSLRQRSTPVAGTGESAVLLLAPFAQSCSKRLNRTTRGEQVTNGDYYGSKKQLATGNDIGGGDDGAAGATRNASMRSMVLQQCVDNHTSLPAIMESFAASHGIACLSARRAIVPELIRSQHDSSRIRALLRSFLGADLVHPNPAGHRMLAELILHALTAAAAQPWPSMCGPTDVGQPPASAVALTGVVAPAVAVTPAGTPLSNAIRQRARSVTARDAGFIRGEGRVCALGPELRSHVISTRGWGYEVERSQYGFQPKPGFIARTPGSTLDVCYRPPNVTATASASRDHASRWLQLGFLRSWAGMGRVQGECLPASGCRCAARTSDAHDCPLLLTTLTCLLLLLLPYLCARCAPRIFDAHDAKARVSELIVSKLRGIEMFKARRRESGAAGREAGLVGNGGAGAGGVRRNGDRGMSHHVVMTRSAPCRCVVRLSVLNTTGSGGYKFKLVALFAGMRLYNPAFAICRSTSRCVEGYRRAPVHVPAGTSHRSL